MKESRPNTLEPFKPMTASEIMALPKEKPWANIQDGYLCLRDQNYDIELSRITSAKDILIWAHHLSEKGWMTADILHDFIEVASAHLGIDLHEFI